jgi:polyhydroxyalkanoate synthesis regulator phasin
MFKNETNYKFCRHFPAQNKEITKMTALLIENEEVQETTNSMITRVQKTTRKVWLASLGLWGLGFDQVNKVATRSQELLADAEKRGVKVEEMATERVNELQTQIRTRLNRAEKQVEAAKDTVADQVENAMAQVNMPTSDQISKLDARLDALSNKVESQVAQTVVTVEPVAGYTDMTAKEIVAMLPELDTAKVVEIKHFELSHDNRVTVLRAVESRLEDKVEA